MQHLTCHADIKVLLKISAHGKEDMAEALAGPINSAM
jgi:hypothetical protein